MAIVLLTKKLAHEISTSIIQIRLLELDISYWTIRNESAPDRVESKSRTNFSAWIIAHYELNERNIHILFPFRILAI